MSEFFVTIAKGEISNKRTVKARFDELQDGRYKVKITKSSKRSLAQNDWLHAILPEIVEGLRDKGFNDVKTTDDAKAVIKALFFKKTISNGIEDIPIIEDTSATSKEDFIERSEEIIKWAIEYLNIDVAPPGKQTELNYFDNAF